MPTNTQYTAQYVECYVCTHKWTAVHQTDITFFECPHCNTYSAKVIVHKTIN